MVSNDGEHRPTKVLVLIPTLEVGGAEMDLVRNLPRIDRSRFQIVVCAFLARGTLAQPLLDAGIEVIGPISARPRRSPASRRMAKRLLSSMERLLALSRPVAAGWHYLRLGRAVAGYIREHNIDIVHAILPNSYVVAGIATALAQHPALVMSRVSLNWYHEKYPLLGMVERHVLHRLIDVAICNSAAIRQDLLGEGVPPARIRLIPNGIDLQAFTSAGIERQEARNQLGIAPDALVFSVVANFYPYKGHADLLHALRFVSNRLPPGWILLAIGGDIDGHSDRMRNLSEELGLLHHVRFLGQLGDVALILRAADVHVSASHTEGFPNNVLEAMAASLPVVATAVGGVPEMVADGRTGLLVPAKEPEKLARALLQLAHDPDRRRSMGEAGRSVAASSFPLERSVDALQSVYAGCATRRRP